MKFELDPTDVETILSALQERKHKLQANGARCGSRHGHALLNEVCVTEEKIRHQQSWGID